MIEINLKQASSGFWQQTCCNFPTFLGEFLIITDFKKIKKTWNPLKVETISGHFSFCSTKLLTLLHCFHKSVCWDLKVLVCVFCWGGGGVPSLPRQLWGGFPPSASHWAVVWVWGHSLCGVPGCSLFSAVLEQQCLVKSTSVLWIALVFSFKSGSRNLVERNPFTGT